MAPSIYIVVDGAEYSAAVEENRLVVKPENKKAEKANHSLHGVIVAGRDQGVLKGKLPLPKWHMCAVGRTMTSGQPLLKHVKDAAPAQPAPVGG